MIALTKIINRYSLIFAVVNFIMANMSYERQNGFLFIWICFISFCIYLLKDIKSKKIAIPIAAAFYPLVSINTFEDALAIFIILAYCLYYVLKVLKDVEYEDAILEIKKSAAILIGLIALSLLSFNVNIFERVSWYYIVIFIISSVVYLRALRSEKFAGNDKKNKKLNYINSIAICILTAVISIRNIRDAMIKSLAFLYDKMVELFIFIFSWFFLIIAYIMLFIMKGLKGLMGKFANRYDEIDKSMKDSSYNKIPRREELAKSLSENPYLITILKVLVLILVVYIIFRILKSKTSNNKESEAFIESREYIKEKNNKTGVINRLKEAIKPRNYQEYIRHCYKIFMKKSTEKGIKIQKSDTTADINEKARYSYNNEALLNIRKFYINVRYGNAAVDKASLKLFNRYYRDLKK